VVLLKPFFSRPAIEILGRPSGHQAIRPLRHQAITSSGHRAITSSGHRASADARWRTQQHRARARTDDASGAAPCQRL